MNRIAIISDIHGNLEALKAVLKDIKNRNIDEIYCIGDIIAKGAHSIECLNLVKENCKVVVTGNCDEYFSKEHENIEDLPELEQKRVNLYKKLLNEEEKAYLQSLPYSYEFYMSGSLIRLFHATPWQLNKAIINQDKVQDKYKLFLGTENTATMNTADVVIYGHIHHCYADLIYNKTLINVGSVGNSYNVIRNEDKDSNTEEVTKAFYVIIEGNLNEKEYNDTFSYQFVRVPYNIEKELETKPELEQEDYEYELRYGKYRNMKKVEDNFKKIGVDINF